MRKCATWMTVLACICSFAIVGCHERRTTRKVTVEGPDKKTEVKLQTTDK